jgi:magnesium transporter
MSRTRKKKLRFSRQTHPGSQPGLVVVDPQAQRPTITVFAYGQASCERTEITDLETLPALLQRHTVTWINVDGLGDAATIQRLGKMFSLHPLALEDAVNVHQRPKVDEYPGHLYIVARYIHLNDSLDSEQISIFLGKNYVLTFQEESRPGDPFDPIRTRLKSDQDVFTNHGADYLAYRLLDAIVDSYFPVLEYYGEKIDDMEALLLESHHGVSLGSIHKIKQDLLQLRRALWPMRDMLYSLLRDKQVLIDDSIRVYFRDCYDHTVQLVDLLEIYRELGSDLRDLYLSSMSNRMNEIMKVLTIISTLFIPLTFIAGVYGMNFDTAWPLNMPELRSPYGYVITMGVMGFIAVAMFVYFVRKGWIGERFFRK